MIPYGFQEIDKSDIKSVAKVLQSKVIARGNKIYEFEKKFKNFVKSKFSVSVNSATSALHLSCLAIGVNHKSIVWVPANSFTATANCALYCGAKIDFLDINLNDFNLDIESLKRKLSFAKKINKTPDVIIGVHLGGNPFDQESLYRLSRKYNFKVIEDASHALGSINNKNKVGNCRWSDIAIFSFHPVKIITTGEGGMITTNNKTYFNKLKLLRNHGISKDVSVLKRKILDKWYYEQQLLGYNYWMTDFQAALGISQLKKLRKFIKKRNQLANFYKKKLKNCPIFFQKISKNFKSSYHLFIVRFDMKKMGFTYSRLFKKFLKNKIGVNLHYFPIYHHPYYQKLGFKNGYCKNAEKYAKSSFSIPLYTQLKLKEQKKVISFIEKVTKNK